MSKADAQGRKLGTLVVVVLKARNLPNKQRIGKQDPYCSLTVGHQKLRTQPVKRGGQTPHWDAQLEFEVWEQQAGDTPLVSTETGGIAPAAGKDKDEVELPGTATVGSKKPAAGGKAEGKRILKLACYADDPRDPELIGEASIDFTNTLKKGEFDDWVELSHRARYAGEVYIEMTFWSAGPAPVNRKTKPVAPGYGGPGAWTPLPDVLASGLQSSPAGSPSPATPSGSSSPAPARPAAGHLTPSKPQQHPLRTSQSHAAFPTPSHRPQQPSIGSAYTPVYAPPSLASPSPSPAPSSSTTGMPAPTFNHPHKPHRSSFSSYGMTPHDIDSLLTRPMSSISINKPLPSPAPHFPGPAPGSGVPDPYQQGGQRPPSRSNSAQAYAQRPPSRHTTPYQDAYPPTSPHPPAVHGSQSPAPNHFIPSHSHRHSLATYLPSHEQQPSEVAYSNWNNAQIQHLPPEAPLENYHMPNQQAYQQADNVAPSWRDPRDDPVGGLHSPNQYATYDHQDQAYQTSTSPRPISAAAYSNAVPAHPPILSPGRSPQPNTFAPASPPPSSLHHGATAGSYPVEPYRAHTPVAYGGQGVYEPIPEQGQAHQYDYSQQGYQHDGYQQDGYQQDGQHHYPAHHEHAPYEAPQPAYQYGQQGEAQYPTQQMYDQPPPQPYYPEQAPHESYYDAQPVYQPSHTPRPLPQPVPSPTYTHPPPPPPPRPSSAQPQHQQYYPSTSPAPSMSSHHSAGYQPRFGLPPHQAYDEPYRGGGQSPYNPGHSNGGAHPGWYQKPERPPVPDGLLREGSYYQ